MKHRNQSDETSEEIDWLTAMRLELARYQEEHDENTVSLHELYDFSESRLAKQFPENDHVRAKIRQLLQRLRDRSEVEFLDDEGTYKIKDRVADGRVSNIREEHSSLESVLSGTDSENPSQEAIEEEKSELVHAVESEPELTEDDTEYVETRRKARDSAFRELVRNTYNNTCAVCGSQRESPDGNPEVEAAHIYPHSEGGSDDIRNGIALCKFHHWAFDSGWLSFTDDHEIIVAEATDKNGYHELKQLEGQPLRLPENEDAHPHPMFLEQHREIQHFD